MKHPIATWTLEQVEFWRRQSACIGIGVTHIFTDTERQQAIKKLEELYSPPGARGVYPTFADKILYLSELY